MNFFGQFGRRRSTPKVYQVLNGLLLVLPCKSALFLDRGKKGIFGDQNLVDLYVNPLFISDIQKCCYLDENRYL